MMQKAIRRFFPLFVLPTLLAFTAAFLVPFLMGLYLSFTEFTTVSDARFVGFANYVRAFTENREFIDALLFTVKFTVVSVVTINVFAFLLALALTRPFRGANLLRTVFFMPNLIGGIVLGYIWQLIINGLLLPFQTTLAADARYGFWGGAVRMNWQLLG